MDKIASIREDFIQDIKSVNNLRELEAIRLKYIGSKGIVSQLLKEISRVPIEERKKFGATVNELKNFIENTISEKKEILFEKETDERLRKEAIDITLPGRRLPLGSIHPITRTMEEITDIFLRLGYGIEYGPDIELDKYNFELLNIPPLHPARDMQATFYISDELVLRTHTSPVQIRTMLKKAPPIKIISPGTVYRCDSDATHSPMFHQVEGLLVDRDVSFEDLRGTIDLFLKSFFGQNTKTRFRASYFPFTEPSAEVDIECQMCMGKGCNICKNSGFLEVMGCGMVNPYVLKNVNIDPEEFTGFAFGMGVERMAMLKYKIPDLRLFFDNDLRFLGQF
ncbi:MAG: phenylalanine--tRNA ligase subunit alpha [Deltaproteobacteria bacterium]|nr:phenylalanine--tRNA ligase subunit alpha [Deltaproteobacteria bacterium]